MAMFVAHAAPSAGALNPVFMLGDYIAVALFATALGAGAQLGADAFGPSAGGRRLAGWLLGSVARGALLVVLGALAEQFEAQIVGVLFHLGALAALASLVVLLPTPGVAGTGVLAFVVAPWLKEELAAPMTRATVDGHQLVASILDVLGGGTYYRLPTLLVWACLGALVVRWWRSDVYRPGRAVAVVAASAMVSVALLALHRLDVVGIPPYSGSHGQTVLSGVLSVGLLAALLVLTRRASRWVAWLAGAGSMALTMYVAQHAFLGWWVRDGASDDTWITLLVLTIGATVGAVLWRSIPLPEVLRRGLLDGPVSWLSGRVRDGVAGTNGSALSDQRTTRRRERG